MVKMWGPSVGPTGDPDGLDPSEVPDDVPVSLLHGSSYWKGWKMLKYSDDNIMLRNLRGRQTGRIRM